VVDFFVLFSCFVMLLIDIVIVLSVFVMLLLDIVIVLSVVMLLNANVWVFRFCLIFSAATELVTRSIKVMMESGCEEVYVCINVTMCKQ